MKKTAFYFVVIVALLAVSWVIRERKSEKKEILGTVSQSTSPPRTTEVKTIELSYGEKMLSVYWFEVEDLKVLDLVPNFEDQLRADETFEKYQCKYLVSGGFYTKDNQPVGLFIKDHEEIRGWQKNNFFNGVFSVNDFEVPRITTTPTRDPSRVALQSGPLIKENASFKKLSIKNDEEARRVVVGVTGENKSVFMIIYDKDSVFLGPLLVDLPEVIKIFEERSGIELADALNLDGGTASTFYTGEVNLPELSPVGAFFCI